MRISTRTVQSRPNGDREREAACEALVARYQGSSPLVRAAGYLHVSEEQVREAQEAAAAFQAASLDAPLPDAHDEGSSLADLLGAEDPGLERIAEPPLARAAA